MHTIRKGEPRDIAAIAVIYDRILDREERGGASTGWIRGVYPTADTARAALEAGKTLAVPLCMGPGVMQARAVRSLEELAPAGPYGIPEPPAGAPEVPPQRLALCVLPCLAAAPDGTRLGYGGGYYDRFLPLACNAVKIALCRAALLEPVLPRECHDVRADFVLTEDALYGCKGGG